MDAGKVRQDQCASLDYLPYCVSQELALSKGFNSITLMSARLDISLLQLIIPVIWTLLWKTRLIFGVHFTNQPRDLWTISLNDVSPLAFCAALPYSQKE
jgi:hypothetical protein